MEDLGGYIVSKNKGKVFESSFQKSIPKDIFCRRLPDSPGSWAGGKTTFTVKQIADFELYDGNNFYFLELKHVLKGTSISLNNIRGSLKKDKKTYKKEWQIKKLTEASNKGVICGLLVYFNSKHKCYFLDINDYNDFVNDNDRKSIPISYFEEEGIEVDVKMLSVNIRLDIKKFLSVFE